MVRPRRRLLICSLIPFAAVLPAACQDGDVCLEAEVGCAEPAATPTPANLQRPSQAEFETVVAPLLNARNCSDQGCHAVGTAGHTFHYTKGAAPGSQAMTANYEAFTIQFTCFNPPLGEFVNNFTPAGLVHNGNSFSDTEVDDILAWARLGQGGVSCP